MQNMEKCRITMNGTGVLIIESTDSMGNDMKQHILVLLAFLLALVTLGVAILLTLRGGVLPLFAGLGLPVGLLWGWAAAREQKTATPLTDALAKTMMVACFLAMILMIDSSFRLNKTPTELEKWLTFLLSFMAFYYFSIYVICSPGPSGHPPTAISATKSEVDKSPESL